MTVLQLCLPRAVSIRPVTTLCNCRLDGRLEKLPLQPDRHCQTAGRVSPGAQVASRRIDGRQVCVAFLRTTHITRFPKTPLVLPRGTLRPISRPQSVPSSLRSILRRGCKLALTADTLPVSEEKVGKGQHGQRQERQKGRCPLVAQLLVHLHAKQWEGS